MNLVLRTCVPALIGSALLAGSGLAGSGLAGGKGTVVTIGKLKSTAPADWKEQEIPKMLQKFRVHQFQVPQAPDDKDKVEFYISFLQGAGGGASENIKRWKDMFDAPEGKTLDEAAKVQTIKAGGAELTYLDIQGTYKSRFPPFDPMGKIVRKPGYRMLGVYFPTDDGPYFIRMTGPARSIELNRKAFEEWIKAFK